MNKKHRELNKIFGPGGMNAIETGLERYIKELKRRIEIFRVTGEEERIVETEELLNDAEKALDKIK